MIEKHDFKYIQSGNVAVLVDGQFGSTGKGLLAAFLASQEHSDVDIATTNASANAGHWTKYETAKGFVCYHLPTFGVIQGCVIYLNAGSVINPELLLHEMEECGVNHNRVRIHPSATIITQADIDTETNPNSQNALIASTQKGVGAALARKILRTAETAKDCLLLKHMVQRVNLNIELGAGASVSLEVPQGYSLSLNGPFYPHVTSRNCTVGAGMADAGIHPSFLGHVAQSLRTYPIRVGNIPGGYSGDVYPDQEETSFEALSQEEEFTTVTKRVRRIFTFSEIQTTEALIDNRPSLTFLNFCNYADSREIEYMVDYIQDASRGLLGINQHMLLGHGPNVEDVKPLIFEPLGMDG